MPNRTFQNFWKHRNEAFLQLLMTSFFSLLCLIISTLEFQRVFSFVCDFILVNAKTDQHQISRYNFNTLCGIQLGEGRKSSTTCMGTLSWRTSKFFELPFEKEIFYFYDECRVVFVIWMRFRAVQNAWIRDSFYEDACQITSF